MQFRKRDFSIVIYYKITLVFIILGPNGGHTFLTGESRRRGRVTTQTGGPGDARRDGDGGKPAVGVVRRTPGDDDGWCPAAGGDKPS